MNRLTVTFCDGSHGTADNLPCRENSYEYKKLLLETLGKYEDAAEKGLFIHPTCKPGDTVWVVTSPYNVFQGIELEGFPETYMGMPDEVFESFVSCIAFYKNGMQQYHISAKATGEQIVTFYTDNSFGKEVFFTREAAEAKLKELNKAKTALADAETDYDR